MGPGMETGGCASPTLPGLGASLFSHPCCPATIPLMLHSCLAFSNSLVYLLDYHTFMIDQSIHVFYHFFLVLLFIIIIVIILLCTYISNSMCLQPGEPG